MDLLLDETQTFLQQAVAGAVDRYAPFSVIRQWIEAGDLSVASRLAADQGWIGIGLDEEIGGQGGGVEELALVAEQLGRGAVPWDTALAVHLAARVLATASEPGRELAVASAGGDHVAVLCIDARTPDATPATVVSRDRVDGTVSYVLGASDASSLVVAGSRSEHEVELWSVARGAEGVTVTPRRLVDRTRTLAEVRFQSAAAEPLGRVPRKTWRQMIRTGVVLNCADSLGASARLLEMTTGYVKDRKQFGVAVGSFQAVKHSAAQMLVDVEGIRSAVQYSAWAVGAEDDTAALQTSVAGAYCSHAAPAVADRALFLHGAIGYTWEHDLQLLFKRIKSNAALFGTADSHRDSISAALGCTLAA